MRKKGDGVRRRDLVPAEWFRSKILIAFGSYNTRLFRGPLASCIDSASEKNPELQFKHYQLYQDGQELPGAFAVAGNVILVEEREIPNDDAGKVCYYLCRESLSLD